MTQSRRDFLKSVTALCAIGCGGKLSMADVKITQTIAGIRYGMLHDQGACIGCTACEDACRTVNHVPEGVSRLKIIRSEPIGSFPDTTYQFFRHSCQHCDDPPCVMVCPTGASFVDAATGIVDVHEDKCVGCKYCIAACPYRVRFIHPETKAADKCDFCRKTNLAAGKQPACVESCPTGALTFGNLDDPNSEINQKIKNNMVYRTKVSVGTKPRLYHIPARNREIE